LALIAVAALSVPLLFRNTPDLARGRVLYDTNCASCHGAELQGQPGWRSANADGSFPAPPHDASGHTWHHDDAMLRDYIKRGGQVVLDGMGVSFTSGMPGFGDSLTDGDIEAVLDYIKSTWPERVRRQQEDRNAQEAPTP
jgi:mono/diheme cytochrome c family protein